MLELSGQEMGDRGQGWGGGGFMNGVRVVMMVMRRSGEYHILCDSRDHIK